MCIYICDRCIYIYVIDIYMCDRYKNSQINKLNKFTTSESTIYSFKGITCYPCLAWSLSSAPLAPRFAGLDSFQCRGEVVVIYLYMNCINSLYDIVIHYIYSIIYIHNYLIYPIKLFPVLFPASRGSIGTLARKPGPHLKGATEPLLDSPKRHLGDPERTKWCVGICFVVFIAKSWRD